MPAFPSVASVALERPKRANQEMLSENRPTRYPVPIPPPSVATERLSRSLSVSARRMLATANADGKGNCMRSTRTGV